MKMALFFSTISSFYAQDEGLDAFKEITKNQFII